LVGLLTRLKVSLVQTAPTGERVPVIKRLFPSFGVSTVRVL
jgi:hypothetical protein